MRTVALAVLLWLMESLAIGQTPPQYNQQKINELAAMVEQVMLDIVEAPRLRQPKEPLPEYMERLFALQPKETPAQYNKRVEGYLQRFRQLATATASARTAPKLKLTSNANTQRWKEITQNCNYLPAKNAKLAKEWQELQKIPQNSPQRLPKQKAFARETRMTLYILVHLRTDLGVARP